MVSEEAEFTEAERKVVVVSVAWGTWEDVGQTVQIFTYKGSKFWESNVQHDDYS